MTRSDVAHLHDMLAMIDAVAEMIEGMDADAFGSDIRTQRAVERCIEIISEASRRLSSDQKARFPDVPWVAIAAMGNILRHEYHHVAAPVVWKTANASLPELRPTIVALMD